MVICLFISGLNKLFHEVRKNNIESNFAAHLRKRQTIWTPCHGSLHRILCSLGYRSPCQLSISCHQSIDVWQICCLVHYDWNWLSTGKCSPYVRAAISRSKLSARYYTLAYFNINFNILTSDLAVKLNCVLGCSPYRTIHCIMISNYVHYAVECCKLLFLESSMSND